MVYMSYSILRVARVKSSINSRGLQKHNQRENENYNNKDIKHEDTHKNYDLINQTNIDYTQKINQIIQDNYTQKRKIRTDAVKHVDGLITSDDEFFKGLSENETKQFFKDSLEFLEDKYGSENMLYATVHLDEKTPHMHFGFVPITEDGRLSAKQMLGNKKDMTQLQDEFNVFVNSKGYDLERGISKTVSEKEHIDMDRFKKDTKYYHQELNKVKNDLETIEKRLEAHTDVLKGSDDITDIKHENELKKVSKGLFNSEEVTTGNKILSSDEFFKVQSTLQAAKEILNDYDRIKNSAVYNENEDLKEENRIYLNQNSRLLEKNDVLTKENKSLKAFKQSAVNAYKLASLKFPDFEKGYNLIKNGLANNKHPIAKGIVKTMTEVQDLSNSNQAQIDDEGKPKKSKAKAIKRSNDLEL